ncbi:MAG: hypothetical protein JWL76_1401 [Thermoleophilia bacterium]|nr:hypothetical protein [Thermoleophilia bacterium]
MREPADTIVIPVWANGPDGSGNGGWSAGLLAPFVPEAGRAGGVAVNLRVPPPIGRELEVASDETGTGRLLVDDDHGHVLVAHAEPAVVSLEAPGAVRAIGVDVARAASAGFPFRDVHPFPRCVSCGTRRDPSEPSLHLHCGPVAGVTVRDEAGEPTAVFADVWTPSADLADPDHATLASVAACWSALDCPSAAPMADPHAENPSVLARIAVRLERRARIGEPHVLAAWQVAVEGRKQRSRSVLLDASGVVLGAADALWIEVRPR